MFKQLRLFAALVALAFAAPVLATGTTSGKAAFGEDGVLRGWFKGIANTATTGATTSAVVLTSATGFNKGDFIKFANPCVGTANCAAGSIAQIASISSNTLTLTTTLSTGTYPVTGAVTAVGFAPAAIYVGLLNTCPTDAVGGGIAEVSTSGTAYARQAVAVIDASWSAISGTPHAMTNAGTITWTQATGSGFGTVNCVGIWDSVTAGSLLFFGPITVPQVIAAGATASIAVGQLSISED